MRILLICLLLITSQAFAIQDGDGNGAIDIVKGGTNATTASGARTNLGVTSAAEPVVVELGNLTPVNNEAISFSSTGHIETTPLSKDDAVENIFDGCGDTLVATTGGVLEIPWDATVSQATVVCDASDTIGFTVLTASYSATPSFSNLDTFALSASRVYQETGLSHELTKGSLIRFDLTGTPASATNCTCSLLVTKD